jgi:hypothetical protein
VEERASSNKWEPNPNPNLASLTEPSWLGLKETMANGVWSAEVLFYARLISPLPVLQSNAFHAPHFDSVTDHEHLVVEMGVSMKWMFSKTTAQLNEVGYRNTGGECTYPPKPTLSARRGPRQEGNPSVSSQPGAGALGRNARVFTEMQYRQLLNDMKRQWRVRAHILLTQEGTRSPWARHPS